MRTATPVGLLALLLVCCGPSPAPFLWGAATSAYQWEGGIHRADWWQWEQLGRIEGHASADDGPDGALHYREDLATAADKLSLNAFRFSIEWSRVEPDEGEWDAEGIAYYHALLRACRDNHLAPVVSLSHFTLPDWLHDVKDRSRGLWGWADGGKAPGDGRIVPAFERFAEKIAGEYGKEVDLWIPLNEPTFQAIATWANPNAEEGFPRPPNAPEEPDLNLTRVMHALTNLAYAHSRAYDAIHASDKTDADGDGKAALVGIAQHMRAMEPKFDQPDYHAATRQAEYAFNYLFLDAVDRGDLDLTLDGKYSEPGEGQAISELAGRLDFIGVNYYSRSEVYPISLKAKAPYSQGQIELRCISGEKTSSDLLKTEVGWDVYPEGLTEVLLRTHERYGLPLYVTENGIADADEDQRPRYILDHVNAVDQARRRGADVRGYLYWSLTDNFEWIRGFGPRFGLLHVNYDEPARPRTLGLGAAALRDIARAGRVTKEIDRRYP